MAHQIITDEIRAVLMRVRIESNLLYLPSEQLDRKLYMGVNAVLENLGGKWNRNKRAHVFQDDPALALQAVLQNGKSEDVKKTLQAFYTPWELAVLVAERGEVHGKNILEPSAGHGALADACMMAGANLVHCVEIDEKAKEVLARKGYLVWDTDFLAIPALPIADRYQRIVMNPPFKRGIDIKHVAHALNGFLAPSGILVSIIAGNIMRPALQKLITPYCHTVEPLPDGSFKSSGTNVCSALLKVWNSA